jgi:hypothetical protein
MYEFSCVLVDENVLNVSITDSQNVSNDRISSDTKHKIDEEKKLWYIRTGPLTDRIADRLHIRNVLKPILEVTLKVSDRNRQLCWTILKPVLYQIVLCIKNGFIFEKQSKQPNPKWIYISCNWTILCWNNWNLGVVRVSYPKEGQFLFSNWELKILIFAAIIDTCE